MNLVKCASELYEVLFLNTEGEAKLIVSGVTDRDGLVAWQKLYKHFNRRTLARILRDHKEAMHPRTQNYLSKLVGSMMEWEDKCRRMVLEETANGVPALWKMAAFLELCPEGSKQHVFQCTEDSGEDYETLRSKVVSWMTNRVASRADKAADGCWLHILKRRLA